MTRHWRGARLHCDRTSGRTGGWVGRSDGTEPLGSVEMTEWHRRRFISTAGLGFAAGIAGWRLFDGAAWAQQAVPTGIPDEILNPVEVSGDEAALVSGRLPGA